MKTQKILIVDDDVGCRIAMEKVFQIYDYEIFSCRSGEQAVLKLKEEFFEILITDLQMPGMDGLELINEARKIFPEIATILVSGLSIAETQFDAKAEGVNAIFRKPVDWDRLVGFLDDLAQDKRSGKGRRPPAGTVMGAAGDEGNHRKSESGPIRVL